MGGRSVSEQVHSAEPAPRAGGRSVDGVSSTPGNTRRPSGAGLSGPAAILALQQLAGNRAVSGAVGRFRRSAPGEVVRSPTRSPGFGVVARQTAPRQNAAADDDWLSRWPSADASSVLLFLTNNDQLAVIPAAGLAYVPNDAGLEAMRRSSSHVPQDLGPLMAVPATGASGTRILPTGPRLALVLDAGFDPSPGNRSLVGMYLPQVQAVMASLGVSGIHEFRCLHVHSDHVAELPSLLSRFPVRAGGVVIPQAFRRHPTVAGVVTALRNTTDPGLIRAGFGSAWQPAGVRDPGGARGDVVRGTFRLGDLTVETVALRPALEDLQRTGGSQDRGSYLARVTRRTDLASVVVIGDPRGADLAQPGGPTGAAAAAGAIPTFYAAMEAREAGSFTRFFEGVSGISGFSHHVGALNARDVAGIMALLDATLLRTGRLRVIEQTSLQDHRRTRADTVELLRRLGVDLTFTDLPVPGAAPSRATLSRDRLVGQGPQASSPAPIPSGLTDGLGRLARMLEAMSTLQRWEPWFSEVGLGEHVRTLQADITSSAATLRTGLRAAAEAMVRVRATGSRTAAGGRDYGASGGAPAAALASRIAAIPASTPAETRLAAGGYQALQQLRELPEREIPMRVALHAALTRGEYSDRAFTYMLGQLDPATRNSVLVGRRGGPSPRRVQFERLRVQFGFRAGTMPSGEFMSVSHLSRGGRIAARPVIGLLAAVEIFNQLVVPTVEAVQTNRQLNLGRNVVPFGRRLRFWQHMNVHPLLVGIEDPTVGSPRQIGPASAEGAGLETYNSIVGRLNAQRLDGLYFAEPGLTDPQVLRLGVWLAENVRNFDEFATLFLDTDQDAVTDEVRGGAGWDQAVWKVRVGRYETSGSNHVEERWVDHPRLTALMSPFVRRLIANTEELMEAHNRGPVPLDMERRLGASTVNQQAGALRRARMRTPEASTRVLVPTLGHAVEDLPQDVRWSSPPVFAIEDVHPDGMALVRGADFNTHATLRTLRTERRTLYLTPPGRNNVGRERLTGNEPAHVLIPFDRLEVVGQPPDRPAEPASGR